MHINALNNYLYILFIYVQISVYDFRFYDVDIYKIAQWVWANTIFVTF